MLIEKVVAIPRTAAQTFELISSLDRVASCIPGTEITSVADGVYHGQLRVKVGPITAQYLGTATILRLDPDERILTLRAAGKDKAGRGGADADFEIQVSSDGDLACRIDVAADVRLRGLAAQFGRGAIDGIIDTLIGQFAANLAALQDPGSPDGAAAANRGIGQAARSGGPTRGPAAQPQDQLDAVTLMMDSLRPQLPALMVGAVVGFLVSVLFRRKAPGLRPRAFDLPNADQLELLASLLRNREAMRDQ